MTSKREFVELICDRYRLANKEQKGRILHEFCQTFSLHRKSAIRLLNAQPKRLKKFAPRKRGPKKKYDDPLLLEVLIDIWKATNLPCAKRLHSLIPLWLPHFDKFIIPDESKCKLHQISAATIDRLLARSRTEFNKYGFSTTKPGTIIKKRIPIKTNQWDETQPGFIEADTVAHCGASMAGMFLFTVNCVDIATGWTESRAVWGKGELGVKNAIESLENHIPFEIKGFDCDNGSEFPNWHLISYFTERTRPVQFTRSRPYRKNDNAHIENKNWTNIRQYLGYERFDNPELTERVNELYLNEWSDYFNFFITSVKLIEKQRVGSKIVKKHDKPKTPFQRCIESKYISEEIKQNLDKRRQQLNPFVLQRQMKTKIKNIMKVVQNAKQIPS
jgi:hypothetical protein